MKEKKDDKDLRELFRNNLENDEIIPSPEVGKLLMGRLARKEFLSFIPSKFNIWYLGGLVITGAVAALIIATSPVKPVNTDKLQPLSSEANEINIISDTDLIINEQKTVTTEPLPVSKAYSGSSKTAALNRGITSDSSLTKRVVVVNDGSVTKSDIKSSVKSSELMKPSAAGINKLQGNTKSSDDNIIASSFEGCIPLEIKFINKDVTCDSCNWTFGNESHSLLSNPVWVFDVAGEYIVTLKTFLSGKLQSESSITINVHPDPVAQFEITPENSILPDDEIKFMNYSNGAIKFKWYFGDGTCSDLYEPTHYYKRYGKYNVSLVAYTEHGCSDSLTVLNAFSGSSYYIEFPNAFLPNINGPSGGYYSEKTDEESQVFHPVASGISEYQLKIFSKRGLLVFESDDINIGWDGYYKGKICEQGVYIWKVRGIFVNGESFTKSGDIMLIKY